MSPADKLRKLLSAPGMSIMPVCFDGLSARLIERSGFPLAFMGGFAVSAARTGGPDTGLLSYGEMVDQARAITEAVSIPIIGDGDTGYGNAMNVKRTVRGYARAGLGAVMIEDQVAPKRCGHTRGKQVVSRDEAITRIRAAVDARDELRETERGDILILARTDARQTHGFAEALARAKAFADLGADILFVEAPESVDEMRTSCRALAPHATMANMIDRGKTPVLPPAELEALGYKLAAYPLLLLSAAIAAMQAALDELKAGRHPATRMEFPELCKVVGFPEYDEESSRYAANAAPTEG